MGETSAVSVGRPRRRRGWILAALALVAAVVWWKYVVVGAITLLTSYRVIIENRSHEPVVAGVFEAYGWSHPLGRIEPGRSLSLRLIRKGDASPHRLRATSTSGETVIAEDEPYAPMMQTFDWVILDDAVTLRSTDWSGRFGAATAISRR